MVTADSPQQRGHATARMHVCTMFLSTVTFDRHSAIPRSAVPSSAVTRPLLHPGRHAVSIVDPWNRRREVGHGAHQFRAAALFFSRARGRLLQGATIEAVVRGWLPASSLPASTHQARAGHTQPPKPIRPRLGRGHPASSGSTTPPKVRVLPVLRIPKDAPAAQRELDAHLRVPRRASKSLF